MSVSGHVSEIDGNPALRFIKVDFHQQEGTSMHEVKSALLPEIISYGKWTKGEAQKNSNHMLSEITASVTQHMHAQT